MNIPIHIPINIPKKTRKIVACYLAALILLYVVIYVIPRVTDLFETTQILENGTLVISCETEGYIVKDEAINLAYKSGLIRYEVEPGTVVKRHTKIVSIKSEEGEVEEDKNIHGKYARALENLQGYKGVQPGAKSQISGTLTLTMDGNEKYFRIENLDNITKDGVSKLDYGKIDLERSKAIKGEPIFKVSSDNKWYVVCWLSKKEAKDYDVGTEVRLEMPGGNVAAEVYSVKKEGKEQKVVFHTSGYYEPLAETRRAEMSVVRSNNTGLIVDNECIIEVDGVKGVYVVDKDGDYVFKPVNITASDGKQSVLSEKTFTNDKYELVETVIVHDEVLRDPQKALEMEDKK